MTPSEFKAWFEGFTEAFDSKIPTKVQWARIKERIGEIDGKPITERVFVDRWYPYYRQWGYVYTTPTFSPSPTNIPNGTIYMSNALGIASNSLISNSSQAAVSFDSAVAMNAVGRAEAGSLAA